MKSLKVRRAMRHALVAVAAITAQSALGQDRSHLAGTYQVVFQPVQSAGKLNGCSLVFKAIVLDHAYQRGHPTMIAGNITFSVFGGNPGLSLKLGLGDALATPLVFAAPHFAYMQTRTGSTAGSIHNSGDPEPGYRLFIYRFDDAVVNVMRDMIDARQVTLGFNRKKDGMDILLPLDLSVESATFEGSTVHRKHSSNALEGFADCFTKAAAQVR